MSRIKGEVDLTRIEALVIRTQRAQDLRDRETGTNRADETASLIDRLKKDPASRDLAMQMEVIIREEAKQIALGKNGRIFLNVEPGRISHSPIGTLAEGIKAAYSDPKLLETTVARHHGDEMAKAFETLSAALYGEEPTRIWKIIKSIYSPK
jgi:hypothetical protein